MASSYICINIAVFARVLSVVVVVLALAHLAGQFSKLELGHARLRGFVPMFDMDAETNIPTYFSVVLMWFIALILLVIAVLQRSGGAPHVSKWFVLVVGFVYMSVDEAISIHERLITPLRDVLATTPLVRQVDGRILFGMFYFAWVVVGIAIVFILGLYFRRFLRYLPASSRREFLIAASLYLGGAVGCELVAGSHVEEHGRRNWTYSLLVTVEESLEMVSLVVFIRGLLRYFRETYTEVRFLVDGAELTGSPLVVHAHDSNTVDTR